MDELKPHAPQHAVGASHSRVSSSDEGMMTAYITGAALVILVLIGIASYAGLFFTTNLFGALAVLVTVVMFVLAYFTLVPIRTAFLFFATAALLFIAVNYLTRPYVSTSKFQAVFLTNGQVYFGHLHNPTAQQPTLTDIYYLQSQTQNGSTASSVNTSTSNQNLQLVKLGNELHGPEDMMAINRDQVLFWENLKDSGKVVQAIKNQSK
jgi:hypothetical protein